MVCASSLCSDARKNVDSCFGYLKAAKTTNPVLWERLNARFLKEHLSLKKDVERQNLINGVFGMGGSISKNKSRGHR